MLPSLVPLAEKTRYIYAGCNHAHSFTRRDLVSLIKEVKEHHKKGFEYFIFDNSSETFMLPIYEKILKVLEKCPEINPKNFIYVTGCFPGHDLLEDPKISLKFAQLHERVTQRFGFPVKDHIGAYEIKTKAKKFVCFNKVERPHRIIVTAYLLKENLVDKGFLSFQGSRPEWLQSFLTQKEVWPDWVQKQIHDNQQNFPYVLNIKPHRENPIDIIEEDFHYHRESYFSIVTETRFYKESRGFPNPMLKSLDNVFFTEKTFRPIVLKHPFVLLNRPYALKKLRKLGYKTFSPFIDESYDEIEDDDLRMAAICKEISRLCSFTDEQWLEWQHDIKDIVEHNFNTIWSRENFELTEEF